MLPLTAYRLPLTAYRLPLTLTAYRLPPLYLPPPHLPPQYLPPLHLPPLYLPPLYLPPLYLPPLYLPPLYLPPLTTAYRPGSARATIRVMLSVPPPASASFSRSSHTWRDDFMVLSRSRMRSSETCWVSPSLQSSATCAPLLSRRVTTGSVLRPPIVLESVCPSLECLALAGFMTPRSISSWAMVWSRVSLSQLSLLVYVAAAVPHLEQVGAGPDAEVEGERGGHPSVFRVLLTPAHQLPMAAECRLLQCLEELIVVLGAGGIVAAHAALTYWVAASTAIRLATSPLAPPPTPSATIMRKASRSPHQ